MRARAAAGTRSWRQDPHGRREAILNAAAAAFAREGYAAARMEDIAREAGVAEGTVYTQFESKRALLVATGERYGQGLARAAFGELGSEPAPRDLESVVRNIFRYVRDTDGPLAAFLLANQADGGASAQAASREEMLAAIESVLRRWVEAGQVQDMNPRIAAELQFGLVETALRCCFLLGDREDEESYIDEVTRALVAYVGAQAPG